MMVLHTWLSGGRKNMKQKKKKTNDLQIGIAE